MYGFYAAKTGDWELASRNFKRCLELEPRNTMALMNLGAFYARNKQPAEALEQFKTLLQVSPDHAAGHLMIADLYVRFLDAPDKALDHFERFLALAPGHPRAKKVREIVRDLKNR
jgi:tetratricopeptide (TPR) repeat protein